MKAEGRTISNILTEQICYEIPPRHERLLKLAEQTCTIA
jgi:hypothetical protein